MHYANYRQAEDVYIPRKIEFRGNSLSAHWWGLQYHVYSYSDLIATYSDGKGWELVEPYRGSKTTTRHMNIMRRVTGLEYPDYTPW